MKTIGTASSPVLHRRIGLAVYYTVAVLIGFFMILPFAWGLLTSLKPDKDIFSLPIQFIPRTVTFEHFRSAFTTIPFGLYFWNSFVLASIGVLMNLFFGSLSGYAFARLPFRGKTAMFRTLVAAMTIPGVITMIPLYIVLRSMPLLGGNDLLGAGGYGLLNSIWAVILPGASGPFAVFLMRQFFLTLPGDMAESARIEGAGEFRIFWSIYLPLTLPALAALSIFTFQAGWNSLLWPMIVLNDPSKATIQMGLSAFTYNYKTDYGPMLAGAFVACVPILALFVFLQKYFVRGIAFTGVKG